MNNDLLAPSWGGRFPWPSGSTNRKGQPSPNPRGPTRKQGSQLNPLRSEAGLGHGHCHKFSSLPTPKRRSRSRLDSLLHGAPPGRGGCGTRRALADELAGWTAAPVSSPGDTPCKHPGLWARGRVPTCRLFPLTQLSDRRWRPAGFTWRQPRDAGGSAGLAPGRPHSGPALSPRPAPGLSLLPFGAESKAAASVAATLGTRGSRWGPRGSGSPSH